MGHTLRTASLTTAALLLAVACYAGAAPQGPQPGQSPEEYAAEYVQGQAGEATRDPMGYAAAQATPAGLANQTGQAAYIVCWAAYDATGSAALDPACSPFFTAPGTAQPPAPDEAADANTTTATAAVANATAAAGAFANETLSVVQDVVAEPTSAPSQVDRLVQAVRDFAGALVAAVRQVLDGIVAAVQVVAGALVAAVGGVLDGVGRVGTALGSGVRLGAQAVADASQAVAAGASTALRGAADGVASAGRGIGQALGAAKDGVAGALGAIGNAVKSAADFVGKTVASWFGGGQPAGRPVAPPDPAVRVPATPVPGLVDDLTDRVREQV